MENTKKIKNKNKTIKEIPQNKRNPTYRFALW
jgi:hypothetical protein